MLDEFLELNTKNKLKLISALYNYNTVSQKRLCDVLELSFRGISSLIEAINADIHGIGIIKRTDEGLSLIRYKGVNFFHLFRSISKHSTTLDGLRFLLLNDQHKPFSEFAQQRYLTRSSAYRIRKRCFEFLERIGLKLADNYVVGDEYRIRFLMALLHYKYGVDCYELDAKSLLAVRNFVLATNETIDINYLDCSDMEYGFFEYLVMLTWKRKDYGQEKICSGQVDRLKDIFIYQGLKDYLEKSIGKDLGLSFTEADLEYLFVVYCCTNNCIFADKWTDDEVAKVYKFVKEDPVYADLLKSLAEVFPVEKMESGILETMLMYFYKKCFLGLQCIIPDKNFFTNQEKGIYTKSIFTPLKKIVNCWLIRNGNEYPIDDDHILYLSIQMEYVIRQCIEPLNVYILSDLSVELEVMRTYLSRMFSSKRIRITSVQINSQPKDELKVLEGAIVIVNKKFLPVVYCLELEKNNIVIPISAELTGKEESMIEDGITGYENKEFMRLLGKNKE